MLVLLNNIKGMGGISTQIKCWNCHHTLSSITELDRIARIIVLIRLEHLNLYI